MFEWSSSALTSVGPVNVLHDAPAVRVTVRTPGTTLLTAADDSSLKVTLTASPVTTSEREADRDVKRPSGLRPGTKTSAPPWLVAALNGASTVHVFETTL